MTVARPPILVAVLIAASVFVLGAGARPTATNEGAALFVLSGGGWGHGVGMSQWGAFGQAKTGRKYGQILTHYYRGTTLAKVPGRKVRVLLADGVGSVRVSSSTPFRVRDATGKVRSLPPGEITIDPAFKLRLKGKPTKLLAPLRFRPGQGSPLALGGQAYRGELVVSAEGKRLRAINVLSLQPYLLGVLAEEMPFYWPIEALKAQAVAARSYALARLVKGKPYDLYADWRSQVYGGVAAEKPTATRAVNETSGQVLLHQGKVATTFFHSTSGGRTAAAADVYGSSFTPPYLRSVADPWDSDSPYHRWEPRALTPVRLARALGLASPVVDVETEKAPSGRVTLIRFRTADGGVRELTGNETRDTLALRSTWFRIGVLRLAQPAGKVKPREPFRLTGVARDIEGVELQRQLDGSWSRLRWLKGGADGTFEVVLRPDRTARYRLSTVDFSGSPITIRVTEDAK